MLKVTALLLFVSFVASRAQGNGGFMPRQIHIAFRGVNSDMVVSWSAPNVTHTPLVLFGTSPGSYSNKAMATWTSYYTDFHFNAVLENLSPCKFSYSGLSYWFDLECMRVLYSHCVLLQVRRSFGRTL